MAAGMEGREMKTSVFPPKPSVIASSPPHAHGLGEPEAKIRVERG